MTEKQKMLDGKLYDPDDPELSGDAAEAAEWIARYNDAPAASVAIRHGMLAERLANVGMGVRVRSPFHCDYGYNIHLEDDVFVNFDCTILDAAAVHIGAKTKIGPSVCILTADHPRDPRARAKKLETARPITIGENVWIGAGALILPGVTIGDDAVVGAGSVVNRNVPAGVTVVGNPARLLD